MGSIGFMFERAQRTSKILFLTTSCHENNYEHLTFRKYKWQMTSGKSQACHTRNTPFGSRVMAYGRYGYVRTYGYVITCAYVMT